MARHPKYDYFQAYEQLSELAVSESDVLIETLKGYTTPNDLPPVLDRIHSFEHQGDDINHDIYQNVATDFMPPIDREDIIDLAQAMDTVLDYIEDVLQHIYMYDVKAIPENAIKFAELIKASCQALDKAMEDFRNFKKSKNFKQLIVDVNTYEEEGDTLYLQATRDLFTNSDLDGMYVMTWSRLYSRMERCCDACEHTADIMSTILLKNL